MITIDQLKRGLAAYAEAEMLPKLPTMKQWVVGTAIAFELENIDKRIEQIKSNPLVSAWGIIGSNGEVDIDKLYNKLRPIAERSGEAESVVPLVGSMRFSVADVDKIYDYVRGASSGRL